MFTFLGVLKHTVGPLYTNNVLVQRPKKVFCGVIEPDKLVRAQKSTGRTLKGILYTTIDYKDFFL